MLACLQEGLSNKEIGLMLGISPRTVQKHLQRVYYHLGVKSRTEAILVSLRSFQNASVEAQGELNGSGGIGPARFDA